MVLYSRADSWLGWGESRESDNVLRQPWPHLPDIDAWTGLDLPEPVYRRRRRRPQGRIRFRLPAPRLIFLLAASSDGRRAQPARTGAASAAAKPAGERRARRDDQTAADRARPLPGHVHAERRRLAADRAARHRQHAQHLLHAAADPRCAHGEDSRLLRVFSQPAAAAQPPQADSERNAVRDDTADARPGGRLRQPRCGGGVHHSDRICWCTTTR